MKFLAILLGLFFSFSLSAQKEVKTKLYIEKGDKKIHFLNEKDEERNSTTVQMQLDSFYSGFQREVIDHSKSNRFQKSSNQGSEYDREVNQQNSSNSREIYHNNRQVYPRTTGQRKNQRNYTRDRTNSRSYSTKGNSQYTKRTKNRTNSYRTSRSNSANTTTKGNYSRVRQNNRSTSSKVPSRSRRTISSNNYKTPHRRKN